MTHPRFPLINLHLAVYLHKESSFLVHHPTEVNRADESAAFVSQYKVPGGYKSEHKYWKCITLSDMLQLAHMEVNHMSNIVGVLAEDTTILFVFSGVQRGFGQRG